MDNGNDFIAFIFLRVGSVDIYGALCMMWLVVFVCLVDVMMGRCWAEVSYLGQPATCAGASGGKMLGVENYNV